MLGTTSEAGARAEERLRSEEVARRATVRPDGQPQSVPVWFLWDGEGFLVYSRPGARKLRNIEANPKINLNLNSNANGGDVVRAECVAEVLAVRDGDPSVCQGFEGEESAHAGRRLARKYPVLHGLLIPLVHRLRGNETMTSS